MRVLLRPLTLLVGSVGFIAAPVKDGLKIQVNLAVECGRKSHVGDTVTLDYIGTFTNGTAFDSDFTSDDKLRFTIGSSDIIKGLEQGVLDMCIGEMRTLTIPPELAYDQREVGPIPPNTTLVFLTKLLGIEGVPTPDHIITKPIDLTVTASVP